MTTQELYIKYLNEEVNGAHFLAQVRKDPKLSSYINQFTSLKDSIKILKNKGILSETKKKDTPSMEPDNVNPYELKKGIRVEMEHTDDPKKAEKIALDHLAEDPMYYTRLLTLEKEVKNRVDLMVPLSKKKDNIVDDSNSMTLISKAKPKPNTKDTLGAKEKASKKNPEGVKIMKLKENAALDEAMFSSKFRDKLKEIIKQELKNIKEAGLYTLKNPSDVARGLTSTLDPDDTTEKSPEFLKKYKKVQ